MRCQRIQQLYEDYSRGTLAVGAMARVEEHLAGCPACRNEYELNDKVAQSLRLSGEVAHPGGDYFDALNAAVMARLDDPAHIAIIEPPPASGAHSLWRQPVWWLGGLSAAALVALGLFSPMMPDATRRYAATPATSPTASPSIQNPVPASPVTLASLGDAQRDASAADLVAELYARELQSRNAAPLPPRAVATPAPRVRQVALTSVAQPPSTLPAELAAQFEAIRQDLIADDDADLYDNLRDLSAEIKAQPNGEALQNQPLVRQIGLYLRAQDDLAAGRAGDAATSFRRMLLIDEKSPLGLRASLQLADLYHNEWADFRESQAYYTRCQAPAAQSALSPTEQHHVARQLERLRGHESNQFESLRQLHQVQRGNWTEVQNALTRLAAAPGAADLLPEAARSIVDRVKAGAAPPAETAVEIYKVLESRAAAEQNGGVRAWLELALGDLQWLQFQQLQGAIGHYNKAIEVGGDSGAARFARAGRDELLNRQLNKDLIR